MRHLIASIAAAVLCSAAAAQTCQSTCSAKKDAEATSAKLVTVAAEGKTCASQCASKCSGAKTTTVAAEGKTCASQCASKCSGAKTTTVAAEGKTCASQCASSCSGAKTTTVAAEGKTCASQCASSCSGAKTTTVAAEGKTCASQCASSCSGAKTTTVAAKSGCCGSCSGAKTTTVAAQGAQCSSTCSSAKTTTVASQSCSSSCSGDKNPQQVMAMLASAGVPMMEMRVGDSKTCCPMEAMELSKTSGQTVAYNVAGKDYHCQVSAGKAWSSQLASHLESMTRIKFAVGDDATCCPMEADKMAQASGQTVAYRVGNTTFCDAAQAIRASAAAYGMSHGVKMQYQIGDERCGCSSKAKMARASGTPVKYVVGENAVECQIKAECMLQMSKIQSALQGVALVEG